jgi:hypothetical protein
MPQKTSSPIWMTMTKANNAQLPSGGFFMRGEVYFRRFYE